MKKLLALVLALVMVLSVTVVASADTIKLEKHPYEKPVRELPYYHYQTVPDSIQTPSFTVTSDWDANATTKKGTVTFAFNTTKDATVADMVANIRVYDENYDPTKTAKENKMYQVWDSNTIITGDDKDAYDYKNNFSYNAKTGKLELTFKDLPILDADSGELKNCSKLTLVTTGTKWGLNNKGEKEAQGTVNYVMNFEWNPKTDKMEVVGSDITSTIYNYSTDAVEATTVEYYANGNPKSVTIKHIDTNHVAGTQVNTDEYQHDYQEGADNDHTDHRYAEATFYYTEEGKLDYYWYNTEVDGSNKQPTTPNDFYVTATGDVMNATVNVKGIEYKYYTKDYWVNVMGKKPSEVTPGMLGWFVPNGVDTLGVAVAAPEGYENGFANTVHLFATRHWYPKNTVGVVGLSLRDEYPGLTDKWINIVPVDLTVQGTQEIELVAGNMFHIGKAFVDVDGDNVTVTYSYTNNVTEAFSECVKWFKNVDEITTEFCENPTSDLVFGQPVSIANDLGGQEVALLYICNSATYYQTFITKQDAPTRYYENLKKWQNYRAGLYELLEKIPE